MLPRLLAALVVAAVGFVAAFFIGRATANEAQTNPPLRARSGSVSVVVLQRNAPAIALPTNAGALPPLVQPPPTTQQSEQPPPTTQQSEQPPTIGVG